MIKIFAIVCLLGAVSAVPLWFYHPPAAHAHVALPKYGFNYVVSDHRTGDHKSHTETRIGNVVKGAYSLTEPDGTLRIVHYEAGPKTGFTAHVERVGTAVHHH